MAEPQTVSINSRAARLQAQYGFSEDEAKLLAALEHGADFDQVNGFAEQAHENQD